MIDLDPTVIRIYLRPLRVFLIAVILGLILGVTMKLVFSPLLDALQAALFYRISKPLEIIQGPLSGVLGTEEAVTALYLLVNNLLVSFIAAFGGLLLVRYTMKPEDESPVSTSRITDLLHRLIGEGNETYKEQSVLIFLLPLAVVFVNGAVLGLFSIGQSITWREFIVFIAYILPHGVIELPAVILASTIGYANARRLDPILDSGDLKSFIEQARRILRSGRTWGLFSIVVLMIVSAAAIETYVTPDMGRRALQRAYFRLEPLNDTVGIGEPAFVVLRAAFDSNLSFHSGSPQGPELRVRLVGREGFPFEVDGASVGDAEVVESSRLSVLDDVVTLLLEFSVESIDETTRVFIVARHLDLRDEANLTVTI
jgi:uncharacterized membrane protein SpoIIM required for sporulation